MDDDRDLGAAFAIPDLWGPPKFLLDSHDQCNVLFSDLKLADLDEPLPNVQHPPEPEHVFFGIPDFSIGSPPDLHTPVESIDNVEQGAERPDVEKNDEDDVWLIQEKNPPKEVSCQSWDLFVNESVKKIPHTPYITEAGPTTFDAAIIAEADHLCAKNSEHSVVDSRIYASSLMALGLGRSSVFYVWSEEKKAFTQTLPKIRLSGYSGDALDGLVVTFKDCGNTTRSLQHFIDKTYAKSKSPGIIALADAVSTLLVTIQSRLSTASLGYKSLLQLQTLFSPAHAILACFHRIVKKLSSLTSDEDMLSMIFKEVQFLEHRTDSLRAILLEVLARVSRPWLEFSGEWLGLRRESGLPITKDSAGKSFVKVEDKEWIDEQGLELQESDYALNYDLVPSFFAPEDARSMFEVGRSLRVLKVHHAQHPLARADVIAAAHPPSLDWKFSWQDIVHIEERALRYEKELTDAIRQFSNESSIGSSNSSMATQGGDFFRLDLFGEPREEMQARLLASTNIFDEPLVDPALSDGLSTLLHQFLDPATSQSGMEESIFAPPISLTPVFSFNPIISAQARMVNTTCMRLFFKSHRLREHLTLQKSFHLLGNGVFSSRLSHALFDPELETAERHRGVARSGGVMGLRLGGRDTWPPASSELRLALMGVLTESFESDRPLGKSLVAEFTDRAATLPGDLSFAVRDMTSEEIDACMNPDSVEALDFLRLSYKPPAPLEAIFTPIILYKYDQLFKLLLRVVRMLYVVSALHRDAADRTSQWQDMDYISQRLRIEAHHFISSVSGYFFDTGIESTWQVFERKLDQVEKRINNEAMVLGQNEGLDKLREYHERVLDRIMFALLLRKRQQPIMKLLEDIFTIILRFAKYSRDRALGVKRDNGEVREMYLRFHKKVGVFITVCRSLSEKKGYGERKFDGTISGQGGLFDGHDLAEENTVAQLLARLEMSDYYSRAVQV
ncbi:Spc97/Spc98 family protein [Phlyctema vagabunda]|uniref:Spindle pole body component n=1 Tax=Phlyctema vagabunda TaxID=108571 RepID=A0ABR4P569_9HELO